WCAWTSRRHLEEIPVTGDWYFLHLGGVAGRRPRIVVAPARRPSRPRTRDLRPYSSSPRLRTVAVGGHGDALRSAVRGRSLDRTAGRRGRHGQGARQRRRQRRDLLPRDVRCLGLVLA